MKALRLTLVACRTYGIAAELPQDLASIRRLVASLARQSSTGGVTAVHAGQLKAAWLINAALSRVIDRYHEWVDAAAMSSGLAAVETRVGRSSVDRVFHGYNATFGREFPSTAAERADMLEHVLLVWLANVNPALAPLRELFHDERPRSCMTYKPMVEALAGYFRTQPPFGPDTQPLVTMLRSPAVAVPHSLSGQLAYMRDRWGAILGDLLDELLLAIDLLAEDERALWLRTHPVGPSVGKSSSVYEFTEFEGEPEGFSRDRDWHPRVVLQAKVAHVWLDQLSKRYGRDCRRLDDIPDEELDSLSARSITALWLIGIWQRSRASERIKRLRGNPDAAASAYALDDYRIADDLGGEAAWASLRDRAWARGIRLSADMVPNHMGLDSRWVVEHPDWFLSLPERPYPSYSFNGPDLSDDSRTGIVLEDHYWDGSDAAIVFKRFDRASDEARYIYHGNDGTGYAWNDTAQLNFLRADVREEVIQTILDVARRFPIIRFDAAMVLAKRSIRRLWWPEPGSASGAIPSRAEHALSARDFNRAMPAEFWREVVDRVAAEGLDTLLLAEAFWLMEGYFVRTLGMHRVYNSAFMHMLRDERNAEYRLVMRNTLEFDPEVLKRYVNFMNNPDEQTAVEQFGKEDKYFGVCTLLATLPGLPMLGHGQIEGLAEKYGMEFRRAYWDEPVDDWLVARHEREIFPLLRRRAQFADVRDFRLYDFVDDRGWVNEDVFAYSNGHGEGRSLIIYNNRFASTSGAIRESVGFSVLDGQGGRKLMRRTLAEGLGLPVDDESAYVTFRDQLLGLEYLRAGRELRERGLWVSLNAYGRHVFLDFRDIHNGPDCHWGQLADRLAGRGVPSIDEELKAMLAEPAQAAFPPRSG